MQTLDQSGDDPWSAVAPIIDEALEVLPEQDRSAILLRYFEGRDLRSVGEAFRISEDAAQKRVQRALERLKSLLGQKGIAVSAITLGSILTANASPAVASPPIVQISTAAAASASTSNSTTPFRVKAAAAFVVVQIVILCFLLQRRGSGDRAMNGPVQPPQQIAGQTEIHAALSDPAIPSQSVSPDGAASPGQQITPEETLLIHVLDASTKQPIPRAKVRISNGVPPQPSTVFVEGDKLIVADDNGVAQIPLAGTRKDRLMLQTYADDHADWVSIWNLSKGEIVPKEYTVALEPGVPLGGRVVDESGDPVAGAGVRIGTVLRGGSRIRSSQQMQIRTLTNITDAAGAWHDTHIPETMIGDISLNIGHPEFVKTHLTLNSDALGQLRAGSFTVTLAKGLNISGRVTTQSGAPITNALVSNGRRSYAYRLQTQTDGEGHYQLKNISREGFAHENVFSVVAEGYAAASHQLPTAPATDELNFILAPGGIIRGRVVNTAGEPLSNVRVIREPPSRDATDGIEWYVITENDGRFFWNGCPNSPQSFYFGVPGYAEIRDRLLIPRDEDYVIVLQTPNSLKGAVKDAATGKPLAVFYAALAKGTTERITQLDTTEQEFKNGSFEFQVGGSSYDLVRIRAQGYFTASFPISPDKKVSAELQPSRVLEGVVFDVDGRPAPGAEIAAVSTDTRKRVTVGKGRLVIQGRADQTHTDQFGRFRLSLSAEPTGILALHPNVGIVQSSMATFETANELHLRPWARVEGILLTNNIPIANQRIAMMSFGSVELDFGDFGNVKTDDGGRFVFEAAPPGSLFIHLRNSGPNQPGVLTTRPITVQTNILATPGTITYVTLDAARPINAPKGQALHKLRVFQSEICNQLDRDISSSLCLIHSTVCGSPSISPSSQFVHSHFKSSSPRCNTISP